MFSKKSKEDQEQKKSAKSEKSAKNTKDKKGGANKKSKAKKSSGKSFHPLKSIGKFFREYRSEIKKISWPTVKDTTKNTLITLAAILVVGVFIWALDYGLTSLRTLALENIPEWSIFSSDTEDVSDSDVSDSDVSDSDASASDSDSADSAEE